MITYTKTVEGIAADQLQGFFAHWPQAPSEESLLRILNGSDFVVLAQDGQSNRVVGYVTAISDGVSCAYIPLLEVLAPFQGRGIGSELVRSMLETLKHLYMIDITCDPDVQSFYTRLGFQPSTAMIIRNYDRQRCE